MKKITAFCLTYNRPVQLGRVVECFNRQTYQNREMIILDDAGMYPSQPSGDRWRVVSVPDRFGSMCEKRNACAALARDADYLAVTDDDDIYLPHWLESLANGLDKHRWVQPTEAYEFDGHTITRTETFNRQAPQFKAHHGQWAYRREAFLEVGGYPPGADDDLIAKFLRQRIGPSGDSICPEYPEPFYIYSRETTFQHVSPLFYQMPMQSAWEHLGKTLPAVELHVGFDRDYFAMPRPAVAERRAW